MSNRFWNEARQLYHYLGRNQPTGLLPRMHLRNYARKALKPAFNKDYAPKAASVLAEMYDNDNLGCCVPSGLWHARGIIEANAGRKIVLATDAQIIADYGAMGGYDPNNASTDRGCDEQTALNVLVNKGFADGQKIIGYLSVNTQDENEYCWALENFANLILGLLLGKDYVNVSTSGFVWNAEAPDPTMGHCVAATADSDPRGLGVATWAMTGILTHAAIKSMMAARYGGEMWVFLTEELLDLATQRSPNDLDWKTLVADFDQLGGTVPMPIDPTPPTPPGPTPIPPTPGPTPNPTNWTMLIQMVLALLQNLGPQAEPVLIAILGALNLPAWLVTFLQNLIHFYLGKSLAIHWKIAEEE
jgi:hypothetical protein